METLFNIFNETSYLYEWVNASAPGHDYLVKDYDKSRELLTVEVHGRTVAVAFKQGGGYEAYPGGAGNSRILKRGSVVDTSLGRAGTPEERD